MMFNGIPQMGYGTHGRRGREGVKAVVAALEVGYRHLDTAQEYETEEPVGTALRQSGLTRSEVFLTTKVARANLARDRFLPSVRESLDTLQVDQLDLTLIHWPSPRNAVPLADYIEALGEAKTAGLTRLIGVSNFTIAMMEATEEILGAGEIATNQVEVHPLFQNRRLRAHCEARRIPVTAYMPLAKGRAATDPVLAAVARDHDATPGQIALAFLMGEGLIVIPASSSIERMRSNLAAQTIRLSEREMDDVRSIDRHDRMCNPDWFRGWDD